MNRLRYGWTAALLVAAGVLLGGVAEPDPAALRAAAEAGDAAAQYDYGYSLWAGGGEGSASREEGLEWLRRAAEGGYLPACRELGMLLVRGEGVGQDRESGMAWLAKAGAGGDGPALYLLGLIHFTEGDREAGLRYLQRAADAGYPRALRELAGFKANGLLPCTDRSEIRDLLERALAGGDGEAGFVLWQQLWQHEGIPAAIGYLRAAADCLYMPAVREYGALLFLGREVPRDREGGMELIRLAALADDPEACYLMSVFVDNGELDADEVGDGVRWLLRAAEMGSPVAQRVYGERLLDGDAVADAGAPGGYDWILRAAQRGDVPAQLRLARHRLHGEGERRDVSQAMRWLHNARSLGLPAGFRGYRTDLGAAEAVRASAAAGDPAACRTLAELYRYGDGVRRDPAEAVRYYRMAAEAGDAGAQAALGYMLTVGDGVPADSEAGYRWLCAAAAQEEPTALVNLARIHARGIGRPADCEAAAEWAGRAAAAGAVWAQLCPEAQPAASVSDVPVSASSGPADPAAVPAVSVQQR